MTTSTDIVNEALQLCGNNSPLIQGAAPSFDASPAGIVAAQIYTPVVQFVGREHGWDMARNTVALTASGTAPFPWSRQYLYPTNGIQVWQVMPTSLADANNPLPVRWVVANALIASVQTKVIHTDINPAQAVYNNNPGPDVWDPGFRQAVVRMLASEFAIALFGQPDTSRLMLQSGAQIEQIAEGRFN